jgi:enoyl-[acyl-carrier protein] reductase II
MENRVCKVLGIEKPIIQGPMLWVTSAEMVAAVSNAGGLGTLGFNGGYTTRVNTIEETAERMRGQFRKIRSLTDKPFAFNYGIMEGDGGLFSKACLDVAIDEGVKYVVAAGDADERQIRALKDAGLTVIFRPIQPSIEAARIGERAGADIIVATGFDEGGSAPENTLGTMSIVPVIADAVDVPVMAAGGIVDSRGVNAAFALGAEGVFVGTAFITSEESPAAQVTKEYIINHESTDTITLKTPVGHERALPTKYIREQMGNKDIGDIPSRVENVTKAYLNGFITGEFDKGAISVNSAISIIKEIKSCKQIIDDLFDGVNI